MSNDPKPPDLFFNLHELLSLEVYKEDRVKGLSVFIDATNHNFDILKQQFKAIFDQDIVLDKIHFKATTLEFSYNGHQKTLDTLTRIVDVNFKQIEKFVKSVSNHSNPVQLTDKEYDDMTTLINKNFNNIEKVLNEHREFQTQFNERPSHGFNTDLGFITHSLIKGVGRTLKEWVSTAFMILFAILYVYGIYLADGFWMTLVAILGGGIYLSLIEFLPQIMQYWLS